MRPNHHGPATAIVISRRGGANPKALDFIDVALNRLANIVRAGGPSNALLPSNAPD